MDIGFHIYSSAISKFIRYLNYLKRPELKTQDVTFSIIEKKMPSQKEMALPIYILKIMLPFFLLSLPRLLFQILF